MSNNEKFAKFLNDSYFKYAKKRGRLTSAAEFATWLGVLPTSLSTWMNGSYAPRGENLHRVAAKLGPEVYDLLGLPRMMPNDPAFREIASVWFDLDDETRCQILEIVRRKNNDGGVEQNT